MTIPTGAAEAPAPGLLEGIGATFRVGRADLMGDDIQQESEAYSPLVAALTGATGQSPTRYVDTHSGRTFSDLVWQDIKAQRARRPDFLKEIGDRDQWEQAETKRRETQRGQDLHDESQSSWTSWLIGKAGVAAADPINWGGAMLGFGPASSLTKLAIREAAVNALLETAEQPILAQQRSKRGETLTLGEAAGNIAGAGLFGAAFPIAGKAARNVLGTASEKVAGSIYDRLPASWLQRLSPTARAAADILDREGEIAASNPFARDGSGAAAHEDLLGDALRSAIGGTPMPSLKARMRASVATAPLQRYRPRASGAPLDEGIVSFFVERGLSEATARGVAAGIAAESGNAADAVNPVSGAVGLGQWLGARKEALIKRYGPIPTKAQQLEFLHWELRGGDHGGAHVTGAATEADALDAYVRKFMRPAAGRETDGDLARGMAALGHEGELPTGAVAGDDAELAALEAELRDRTTATQASGAAMTDGAPAAVSEAIAAGADLPPMNLGRVPTSAIDIDAAMMQFKAGGDAFGVTDRLQGVQDWNPLLAGRVVLWEREDGRLFVADGHQRVGLAKRIGAAKGIDIPHDAVILREADGVRAQDARMLAAAKNIAEGTGTLVDAAKVLRAGGRDLANLLPPRSALVRDGKGLVRLSDDAFGAVVNDVVKPEYGAIIGQVAGDEPGTHMRLVDLLAKTKPANRAQAESIVRDGIAAGFVDGEQADMFGALDIGKSLLLERAKVKDAAIGRLAKLKSVFRTAGDNAATLEGGGVGAIDRVKAAKEAMDNAHAAELIQRAANVAGPIKDAIDKAARRYAGGEALDRVTGDLVNDIRAIDLRDALMVRDRLDDAATARSPEGFLDPQPDPNPHVVADLFGDPAGPAVAAQLDSLQHDLKADLDGQAAKAVAVDETNLHDLHLFDRITLERLAKDAPSEADVEEGMMFREAARNMLREHWDYAAADDHALVDVIRRTLIEQREKDWISRVEQRRGWPDQATAYVRLKGAYLALAERGYDFSRLGQDLTSNLRELGWSPGDAAEVLRGRLAALEGQAPAKAAKAPDAPALTYRLSEDGPELTAAQLQQRFEEDDAAIAAVRGCL